MVPPPRNDLPRLNMIAFFLFAYLHHQLSSQQQHAFPVHLNHGNHHDSVQAEYSPSYIHIHVHLKMPDMFLEALGHNVDPKAPLNNTDLAKLLLNDSSTKVREIREDLKVIIDSDREHNKIIVESVVTGICKRFRPQQQV